MLSIQEKIIAVNKVGVKLSFMHNSPGYGALSQFDKASIWFVADGIFEEKYTRFFTGQCSLSQLMKDPNEIEHEIDNCMSSLIIIQHLMEVHNAT